MTSPGIAAGSSARPTLAEFIPRARKPFSKNTSLRSAQALHYAQDKPYRLTPALERNSCENEMAGKTAPPVTEANEFPHRGRLHTAIALHQIPVFIVDADL